MVFYDQRGTGLSKRVPALDITVDQFIDDLDAFVDHFGNGKPATLVGHSWGAMLTSAYAGTHPEKVHKIVLAEPGFLKYEQEGKTLFEASGMPPIRVIYGVAKAWLKKWRATGDDFARDDFFMEDLLPLFQDPRELCNGQLPDLEFWRFGSRNFEATIGKMLADKDFASQLNFANGVDRFNGQTLFMTGGCNILSGADYQKTMLQYFNNAHMEIVPDAGHFMFNDQPIYSVGLLREFLRN